MKSCFWVPMWVSPRPSPAGAAHSPGKARERSRKGPTGCFRKKVTRILEDVITFSLSHLSRRIQSFGGEWIRVYGRLDSGIGAQTTQASIFKHQSKSIPTGLRPPAQGSETLGWRPQARWG